MNSGNAKDLISMPILSQASSTLEEGATTTGEIKIS